MYFFAATWRHGWTMATVTWVSEKDLCRQLFWSSHLHVNHTVHLTWMNMMFLLPSTLFRFLVWNSCSGSQNNDLSFWVIFTHLPNLHFDSDDPFIFKGGWHTVYTPYRFSLLFHVACFLCKRIWTRFSECVTVCEHVFESFYSKEWWHMASIPI